MKIAFVYLNCGFPWLSSSLSYLMTLARERGHKVFLIDPTFKPGSGTDYILTEFGSLKPDAACFSGTIYAMDAGLSLARRMKELRPGCRIIWGGPSATFSQKMIMGSPASDAAFSGESEQQFLYYLDNMHRRLDMGRLQGASVRLPGGEMLTNPEMPVREDLDMLHFADHDFWELERYFRNGYIFPGSLEIEASRGCPYSCSFCTSDAANRAAGKVLLRQKSAKRVVEEAAYYYRKYRSRGLKYINFTDNVFGYSKGFMREFCSMYTASGLSRCLNYTCETRADLVTEEWASLVSRSGGIVVSLGLESGNDYIREKIYNKRISKEKFTGAVSLLRKHNLLYRIHTIYGCPYDTLGTLRETQAFARRLRPFCHNVIRYWPLPGTSLYKKAEKDNMVSNARGRSVPEVTGQGRGALYGLASALYLRAIKYSQIVSMILQSIRMGGFSFISDILGYIRNRDSRITLLKYPTYALSLNIFMHTYYKYSLRQMRSRQGGDSRGGQV